ncbi:helix-turn-helix transcriptional regulator [Streptomyces sp. NPDC001941]|uniref:helix-turn-helix domain-containing protein n=1 Tax=Streptomyces sp. NPDC001941 TaxID=3154659 RepID=UPI0033177BEE
MTDHAAPEAPAIESATPALCRLMLGVELRKLRESAALKAAEVARRLTWAQSKITRLETAENGVAEPSDVLALCTVYGASSDTTEVLMSYASVTKTRRDWWQKPDVRDVITPSFKAYLGLEAVAARLESYQNEFVPGLLQTEDYVRTILERAHTGLPREQIEKRIAVRMTRQEALLRPGSPLEFTAVISESVLRRPVGGSAVMRAQLTHITELAGARPNVNVQVVPFSVGRHPGMNGPFTFLTFPGSLRPIVYLENLTGAGVSRREQDLHLYESTFRELQAVAPGYEKSLSMIEQASKEIR